MMMYTEESIRLRNQALSFLKISMRIDAVAGRVQSQIAISSLQKNLGVVTKEMERAMQSMNPATISLMMDRFEKQFENLDVTTAQMDEAIGGVTASSIPAEEVRRQMDILKAQQGLDAASRGQGYNVGSRDLSSASAAPIAPTAVAAGSPLPPPSGGATGGGGGGGGGNAGGGVGGGSSAAISLQARLDALRNR